MAHVASIMQLILGLANVDTQMAKLLQGWV